MKKTSLLVLLLCSFSMTIYANINWSPPTTISTGLSDASDPRIVIDSNGNATAAWIENNAVQVSSLPFKGEWSKPLTLSSELYTASKPKLGVDSRGNVTALWIENDLIQTTTLPFGGNWNLKATAISESGASNPTLAVDDADNAVAVWVRNGFIESSTRIAGIWIPFTVLSAENSNNPHVAISSSGTVIAAWQCNISGVDTIMTDLMTISENIWAIPEKIFTGTTALLHDFPKVVIDSGGNATVAWFRYNLVNGNSYQNVQIVASSLSEGSSVWQCPTALSNSGIRKPASLTIKLRVDLNGDVLAVWTNSYNGENFTIESSLKPFGGAWPRFASPQVPSLYSFGIDLAYFSGTTLLTNMAWDGISTIQIQSQETDTTNPVMQAWSVATPFSTGKDNGYPQCAMCAIDNEFIAGAVWVSFDGQNTLINASTGSGYAIPPPSNIRITQKATDFGFYQDYVNSITWEKSAAPDIIQYTLFRNGVYFTATDPDTLEYLDHNAEKDGTVTYGIAALISSYRQSEIISSTLNPKTEEELAKEREMAEQLVKKRQSP